MNYNNYKNTAITLITNTVHVSKKTVITFPEPEKHRRELNNFRTHRITESLDKNGDKCIQSNLIR